VSIASLAICAILQASPIAVTVDPEVELLSLVARFAGFREYAMPNSKSPYATAIEEHFAALRDHAAVQHLKRLRSANGVGYDAIASLAVHLGPLPELEEVVPFDLDPTPFGGRLDARWGGAKAREFLVLLRDFAAKGEAAAFFAGQGERFAAIEARFAERLAESRARPWFDTFFGERQGATCRAIPGLLCGGGNYGVGVRHPGGKPEELTPIFGCWSWDSAGLPVFGEGYLPLFVHELCHSYTNPVVDRYSAVLVPIGERLFRARAKAMQAQAYGNGRTVMYETFVRAMVVCCRAETEGAAAAELQAQQEVQAHFTWVPRVAALLRARAGAKEAPAEFDALVPTIAAALADEADLLASEAAAAPKLVRSSPEDGARELPAGAAELVLTFDRPMKADSWSFTGAAADLPKIIGAPRYDDARKTLTVAVELEPSRTYRIGLNSARHRGFQSADGVALEPLTLTIHTR